MEIPKVIEDPVTLSVMSQVLTSQESEFNKSLASSRNAFQSLNLELDNLLSMLCNASPEL